ncbi:MAG: N-6 DNA methylase, partial [Planctomycetes bacterium]|nr:N-6 DNA methylase [Planctomycetota bacterium]
MKNKKIQSETQVFIDAFLSAFLQIARGITVCQDNQRNFSKDSLGKVKQQSISIIYLFISYLFANSRGLLDSSIINDYNDIDGQKIHRILTLPKNSDTFFAQIPIFQQISLPPDIEHLTEAFRNMNIFQGYKFDFSDFDVGIIGKTYETLLALELAVENDEIILVTENSAKKKTGAFYTPDSVVEYILEKTLGTMISEVQTTEDIAKLKILDPAMGCGQFLLGAVDFIRKKIDKTLDSSKTQAFIYEFAENCLYGIDLNPVAVDITRISLWLETGSTSAKHFACFDSLNPPNNKISNENQEQSNFINWVDEFPEIFDTTDAGFNIVLGNPPYISFSGRQAIKLDEKMKQHFKANFRLKGWITTHSLFTELAIKHLSLRFVSFIVPSQVAHLAGYADLRDFMKKHSQIIDVKHWGENVFPDACTPAMTFICERNQKNVENSEKSPVLWDFRV